MKSIEAARSGMQHTRQVRIRVLTVLTLLGLDALGVAMEHPESHPAQEGGVREAGVSSNQGHQGLS